MDYIKVNPEGLERFAGELRAFGDDIGATLDGHRTAASPDVSGVRSAIVLGLVTGAWIDHCRTVAAQYDELAGIFQNAAAAFRQSESANARTWDNVFRLGRGARRGR
ncbi:hypothetical protein LX16_0449 [Stackebrandtia albiflava]|uniref:Uncharacterized protein n=1 Tax=Stackebrandtia albiflava TaxID=406432 RepID=A0A562VA48_9ACTN|nr:hypothetical protein [Stackebrandtia albiflava]TWJ14759.1 hypothetical protein LX16_0449 [Stackebrandtia albiflava]